MEIRPYRGEDFETLWSIDQECFPPGIAYGRGELISYIRHARAFTWVAEDGQGIAGFIVAESDPAKVGHIMTLDVKPPGQRAGVGSKLLERAEGELRQRGCNAVLLEVAVNNAAAIAFYKRHGYDALETIPRYYLESIDALVMGKRLPPAGKRKT